jgi:hypothetical protein
MVSAVYILAWIAIVYLTVGGILEWLDHQERKLDDGMRAALEQDYDVTLPDDPDERDEYVAQLAWDAEHGPDDDPHDPQGVKG